MNLAKVREAVKEDFPALAESDLDLDEPPTQITNDFSGIESIS
jgi:hypothetical protein